MVDLASAACRRVLVRIFVNSAMGAHLAVSGPLNVVGLIRLKIPLSRRFAFRVEVIHFI